MNNMEQNYFSPAYKKEMINKNYLYHLLISDLS